MAETIVHDDAFVPFEINEHELIENSLTWNNYRYTRKRAAYEARAKHHFRLDKDQWLEMAEFFNYECCKCHAQCIGGIPTKDHIVAITIGGTDCIRNIQPLCRECNVGTGLEIRDYRVEWCEVNGLELPEKWRLVYE